MSRLSIFSHFLTTSKAKNIPSTDISSGLTYIIKNVLLFTIFWGNSTSIQAQHVAQPATVLRNLVTINSFNQPVGYVRPVTDTFLSATSPLPSNIYYSINFSLFAETYPKANTPANISFPRGLKSYSPPLQRVAGRSDEADDFSIRNAALAALYRATHGESWTHSTNWDPNASPAMEELNIWHGVTVHMGKITELQLDGNNLQGMLPPEIGDLTDLQVLWVDGNILDGAIPKELGQLAQLRTLLLSHNAITGSIPAELGHLEELETLWLHDNGLSGDIPAELGSLAKLRSLVLSRNMLSGTIPDALGSLGQMETLWLNDNALTGEVPETLGNLEQLQQLILDHNRLSGQLPRSLLRLRKLEYLSFEGQSLCAPSDGAFQSWLGRIKVWKGAICNELQWTGTVDDLSFTVNRPVSPVAFPAAMGGIAPYVYALTPALPEGLMFDSASRLLTGTPAGVRAAATYTYTASDHTDMQVSQTFSIEVARSLANAEDAAPLTSFTLRGNYPNPFRETTRVVFDLPVPAVMTMEVMDLTGRQVFTVPATNMPAGRGQSIVLTGSSLTAGVYFYRVQFSSPEHTEVRFGRLLRVR